jgi:N-glycosylase/DNA lyase
MTCTSEEKKVYDEFQRESKIKLIKMTYKQKIDSQKDNRRKSHQKEKRYKRASPKRKSTLSSLYQPLSLRYGEVNNRIGYEPNRKYMERKNNSGK